MRVRCDGSDILTTSPIASLPAVVQLLVEPPRCHTKGCIQQYVGEHLEDSHSMRGRKRGPVSHRGRTLPRASWKWVSTLVQRQRPGVLQHRSAPYRARTAARCDSYVLLMSPFSEPACYGLSLNRARFLFGFRAAAQIGARVADDRQRHDVRRLIGRPSARRRAAEPTLVLALRLTSRARSSTTPRPSLLGHLT
jgi:hypothetical protein